MTARAHTLLNWATALRIAGAMVVGLGLAALVGWAAGRTGIASAGPGLIPMAPSTAVLFILHGAAVYLRAPAIPGPRSQFGAVALTTLGGLIAFVLLVLGSLDVYPAIARLGFSSIGQVQGAQTGHMSPVTAACFLIASASSLASAGGSAARRGRTFAAVCAAPLLGTSVVFLLAYLYGSPLLYGGTFIPPALTTVLTFAVLASALLGLAWREPEITGLHERNANGHGIEVVVTTFVLVCAGLVAAGHFYSRSQAREHRVHVEGQLSAIADLKARELTAWRMERLSDAAEPVDNPSFAAMVRRLVDSPVAGDAGDELQGWLARVLRTGQYDRVTLVDLHGEILVSAGDDRDPLGPQIEEGVRIALDSRDVVFVDFYRDSGSGRVFLALVAPVTDDEAGDRPLAAVVFRIDPAGWLYPFIQRWPGKSETAETFLVRRDGDDALFLNELRFKKGTALELRSPLSDRRMPAVKAALGSEGIADGLDYRGVPVVADVHAVADSPWFLVARMDASEVQAPLDQRLWQTVLAVAALLVSAAVTLGLVLRKQRLAIERRYRRALDGMMEGAQIIGRDWRYLYVNASAARFGQRVASAFLGRTIQEMHPGVEDTPLFEALRESMADRTARHAEFEFTLPDGVAKWFQFSIQPVQEGLFVLTLDVTDRRLALQAIRDGEERIVRLNAVLRGIRHVNQLITRERDPQALIQKACELMVDSRGFETCCIVVCDEGKVTHLADAGPEPKVRALRRMFEAGELPDCVRRVLATGDDIVVRKNSPRSCDACPVTLAYPADRDSVAVRLQSEDHVFGAMLVSVPPAMTSNPEEFDLLRDIAGDVAFALGGIRRDEERGQALTEIESLARFPSEDPNPVLRFAADGRVLVANTGSEDLLAHWQCAVGGLPPADMRDEVGTALSEGNRRDVTVRLANGRQFALTLAPVVSARYVNGYGMDITARLVAEHDALRLNSRLLRLAQVVQDLSQARTFEAITEIVRHAARDLAASDGATFVLRDGELCHYVDEDAIAPLWKGKRFPMEQCVSGWVMIHREPAVIEDIYEDPRIPHEAYRPTFVRSLVMVPIRSTSPIGAIGNYWRARHRATPEELRILQALADSTSVAMENVRAYQELEQSEARTRAVYEHLPSPTFVWRRTDQEFKLVAFNAAARAVTNDAVARLMGKSVAELPQSFPNLREDLERCFTDRAPVRRELEHSPPGAKAAKRIIATYGFIPPSMVVLHAEDVTEQRQIEEQLRMAQRMEAVGRLAGGVAHDFNNLLSVILNYASLALESMPADATLRGDLEEIHAAGERAAALTRQLLAFSRMQVLQPRVVSLNDVVKGIEGMLRRLIGEDIELTTVLDPDLGNVKVDPGQVEQVVMNLAVNSRDAMPEGGKLTIETSNAELDAQYANEHIAVTPGPFVMISVADSGCGMDEQTRARVFEPFFTTKGLGKGTGLGLATVYGIVKQSGGNIWVYSEVGTGTTFKIYLPRVDWDAEQATRKMAFLPRAVGTETILLVEDDPSVRRVTERLLKAAGYSVLVAGGGDEAVGLCESHAGPIHLVLTDVVMPRMSGPALTSRIAKARPGIPVLYMSGYTDDAIVHHGVLDAGVAFLGKPFSAADLTRKVREVLSAPRASPGTEQ